MSLYVELDTVVRGPTFMQEPNVWPLQQAVRPHKYKSSLWFFIPSN